MVEGISKEILDMLSYRSAPGQSLKQISLREPPLDLVLDDIAKYHSSYIDVLVQENLIGSRFKSEDSILRKYEKTYAKAKGSMTAIAQSISITSEVIWPIRLRFSCGAGRTIFSTSGAISIFTNT